MSISSDSLSLAVSDVCRIIQRTANAGAIRSSSPIGIKIISKLRIVSDILSSEVLKSMPTGRFEVQVSKGMSNIPKVLWVAIVPKGATVSSSPSVTICFGLRGVGIVCGLMQGGYSKIDGMDSVNRSNCGKEFVDVDGPKDGSKYNNKFYLPLELFASDIIRDDLIINHMLESIKVLDESIRK